MTGTRHSRWWSVFALAVIAAVLPPRSALGMDARRPDIQTFIDALVAEDGFEADYVAGIFSDVESKKSVLEAISRPAERVRPWHEYRGIFVTPARISAGVEFLRDHGDRLQAVSGKTGVPVEILTAILGVETFYGTRTGGFRVVDSLATLAFDYPPRSSFFRGELRHLFLLAREEQLDIASLTGSYAGAMGPPQFIPSSYRAYAVDGSGDGRRDLLRDWDDIVASVANYFVEHNWQPGQPIATRAQLRSDATAPDESNPLDLRDTVGSLGRQGIVFTTDLPETAPALPMKLAGADGDEYWVGFQNFYTITRYNRSAMYALAVHQLAEAIAAALPDDGKTVAGRIDAGKAVTEAGAR